MSILKNMIDSLDDLGFEERWRLLIAMEGSFVHDLLVASPTERSRMVRLLTGAAAQLQMIARGIDDDLKPSDHLESEE